MTTTTALGSAQAEVATSSPPLRPPSGRALPGDHQRAGWMFATPFLVCYVLFLIGPLVIGLVVSFFNTATVSQGLGDWVGIANYSEVLTSSAFWASMWHSTLFTLLTTPILVLLPLVFAMLVARIRRNQWFFRLAFFAPFVVPSSIVCLIFAFMYTPETGLITRAFEVVGLQSPNFLGSESGAWFAVVLLTVWWTFGFSFILYLAAIQDIPEELYEAASVDGASPLQQIKSITVPLLGPTISLVLILQVLASLKVFDQIFLLLQGGPDKATRPAIQYIYDTGFTSYRGGYGAAATMVYFVTLVVVSATWALLRRRRQQVAA